MSAVKKIIFVTGDMPNGGIGFELVAQLLAKGSYHVLLGSRSVDKGNAAIQALQSQNLPGSVEMLPLDVTDDSSIESAAKTVDEKHNKLDILVQNAAVAMADGSLREKMRTCFDTNATGPVIVSEFFGPLLRKSTASSPGPRVIFVSSGQGSITQKLDSSSSTYKLLYPQYRASKAAMNMVMACQKVEFEDARIKFFAYCPGFTVSNLGPFNKIENGAKPTAEAVYPLIDIIEGKRDEEAGKLLHSTGHYNW